MSKTFFPVTNKYGYITCMSGLPKYKAIKKIKEETAPVERYETIRKHIRALLEEEILSAKDISQAMRIPEKDVRAHLEHIRKTINKDNEHFETDPAYCEKCGFVFKKRERFSKPGKCPLCHGSLIRPPLFHITKN